MSAGQAVKGIREIRPGVFQASRMVQGVRKSRNSNSHAKAVLDLEQIDRELRRLAEGRKAEAEGQAGAESAWSLEHAYEKTCATVWARQASPESGRKNAKFLLNFFGRSTDVNRIDLERIDEFVEEMQELGNSGGTINRKLSCLSRILRTAWERGKLKHLPRIPRLPEGKNRIRFLTDEEEAKILAHFAAATLTDHLEAVKVLIYTGMRPSELWRLRREDIDLKQMSLTAWKTKNKHPRTIPIRQPIREVITRRVAEARESGLLFPGGSNTWMRGGWSKMRHALGFDDDPQFTPYVCRHTCATRMAKANIHMAKIQAWMGHASINTTARYVHIFASDLFSSAEEMDGGAA